MTKRATSELIRRAREGDVEAFAKLFEELRPSVYAVAYRTVGPNDADDVVMETYLKAWRALPRFNHRSSLKTWLYRIARNCAIDMLRADKRRPEDPLPQNEQDDRTVQDYRDPKQPTAPEEIDRAEMADVVRQAIDELGEPHRSTVLLRYADELSYAEIAAVQDISIGTVMSRLFNAKRKLRRLVDDLV